MEEDVLNALRSQVAYLPGGYDHDAHHLIVVTLPQELHPWTKPHLETSINYILGSLRPETKSNGFTVIVDAQKGSCRVTRTHLRYLNVCMGVHLRRVLVIRDAAFWDTQSVVENCAKMQKKGEPIILPKSRLNKYCDTAELPACLGGAIVYDHERWISNHQRYEEFKKLHERATNDLENLHLLLLDNKAIRADETEQALRTCARLNGEVKSSLDATLANGNELITSVEEQHFGHRRISPDIMDLAQNIRDKLKELETKQTNVAFAWLELEKSIQTSRELSILEEGVTFVTNWILGTAESLLNEQNKVGYDIHTSEQLRKDHDTLEMQCLETYGFYAELLHKIQILPLPKDSYSHTDLMSQKEFMDFVCRSFATRLERRRNVLITSVRFYRLVSEYFDKTSAAFDSLILNNKMPEFEKAGPLLEKVKDTQNSLEKLEGELIKEGEKLSDMLAMPVKDALGCELALDYSEDIINIRDIMDATATRRNLFVDSLELQKLTLQQIIHIRSYETDLATTVKWLRDLFEVLIKNHLSVGCDIVELQHQKDELQTFMGTAKEIYAYGRHLLEASFTLRQSSKLTLEPSEEFGTNLKSCWKKLQDISQEQLTRLRVSTVFHRSVNDYIAKLQDLRMTIYIAEDESEVLHHHLVQRERLLVDVGRTVRLGRLLKTRLREPLELCDGHTADDKDLSGEEVQSSESSFLEPDNSVAAEAILSKLNQVAQMAEALDNTLTDLGVLCEGDRLSSLQDIRTPEPEPVVKSSSSRNGSVSEESTARCSSDQESAVTAPLWHPTSRSSSYHTASECRSSDLEETEVLEVVRIRPSGVSSASNSFDESDRSLMSTSFRSPIPMHVTEVIHKIRIATPEEEEEEEGEVVDGECEELEAEGIVDEEDTSSSTISQISRKQSIISNDRLVIVEDHGENEHINGEDHHGDSNDDPLSQLIAGEAEKVSGDKNENQPDFMAWNRYYQSLINKQTLRSCL